MHTVTGAVTVTTLPSSTRSSLALWQISRTCASGIGRHARSCAMALYTVVRAWWVDGGGLCQGGWRIPIEVTHCCDKRRHRYLATGKARCA
jgi:hypothetical protein